MLIGGIVFIAAFVLSKQSTTLNVFGNKRKKEDQSTVQQTKSGNKIKNLLGIKNILPDGTIIMNDSRYARVFYLSSQDIDLMSEAEQEALELNLIAAMRALDCPVQFFTTTQRIDTAHQVREIDQFLKDPAVTVPETLRDYCSNLKTALENLQKRKELVVRKSYMVIWVQEQNEKVAFEKLDQRIKNTVALLKKANFKISQLTLPEVLQLLGDELNKGQIFKVEDAIKSGALDLVITSKRGVMINDEVIEEVYGTEQSDRKELETA